MQNLILTLNKKIERELDAQPPVIVKVRTSVAT